MEYATIVQHIDCVFATKDHDHEITVKINEDITLNTVTTSCSADKAETEGMILLGTDSMKTCLGHMNSFLDHVNGLQSYHSLPEEYKASAISLFGEPLCVKVSEKKAIREKKRQIEAAKIPKEDIIGRGLREIMQRVIGAKDKYFAARRNTEGKVVFSVISPASSRYTHQGHVTTPEAYIDLATRINGVWHMHKDWKEILNGVRIGVSDWGGGCHICGADGNIKHHGSIKHKKNLNIIMFTALQATSADGMKCLKIETKDEDGESIPYEFKYRKNSKNLIGVCYS